VGKILEILNAIPDRILRYEEYRKLSERVSVPLEVLWSGDKANRRSQNPRSIDVGTPGNSATLSAVEAPPAEKRLLRALTAGGERNSLILSTLNDEFITDPRVRKVVAALADRGAGVDQRRGAVDPVVDHRRARRGPCEDRLSG
jgi:DNA primase